MPPTATIAITKNDDIGKDSPLLINPRSPATELTKINKAETAAVCFIVAQPKSSKTGLKIMPPPTDEHGKPTGLTKLSVAEIQVIIDWINNGAKD